MKTPLGIRGLAAALMLLPLSLAAQPEAIEIHEGNVSELPEGREADGIIGDFVLRNDLVEAVISHNGYLRRPNMSNFYGSGGETPGCLYDLALRGADNDQLTIFCPGNQRGPVSWVRILEDGSDGEAAVETVTSAGMGKGMETCHEYRVKPGESGIHITSTFTNKSDKAMSQDLRDIWTRFNVSDIDGKFHWADALDPVDKCGYAFAWLSPDETKTASKVEVAPGESFEVKRFFAVGASPLEAKGHVAASLGEETGTLKLQVVNEDGSAVDDAVLQLAPGGDNKKRVPAYPDENGELELAYLKGNYSVSVDGPGRPNVSEKIEVGEGAEALKVTLEPATQIAFQVRDGKDSEIPCKVQFHGVNGTPNPNLGPNLRAHGCVDQWHSETGDFTVKLPAGDYRVVITRGPEYSHEELEVSLEQGESANISTRLTRLVDTSGWLSSDFHNHSTPSGDNVCGTDDRVINLAVEHLEFAPTTEHNRIYDWTPHIQKLGLEDEIITIPGMELTGRGAHINSFPLIPVPRTQDGGAPVWEKDPRVNVMHLRSQGGWNPKRWTQINHPDMSDNFIDRNKDKKADGGYLELGNHVDGVETQNYRTSNILLGEPFIVTDPLAKGSRITMVREFIWLQLLNQGANIWGVAVADAHTVYGNGVGSWRVYLPSETDKPAEADLDALVDHARNGHMFLSSGPFMRLKVDGSDVLPGVTLEPGSNSVELGVQVQCTDWLDIDRVQVLVNGRQEPSLNFTRETHPDYFQDGVVKFERTLNVDLKEDTHLIVVAVGEGSNLEKGFGTSQQSPVNPCVYNNPIFLDVDGNGFQPNGDTLGFELPVGGLSVDEVRTMMDKGEAAE